jgi:hypothetical protein
MTDQTNQEAITEIWQLFKETDAKFKETEARLNETTANLRRLEGLFGSQWGRMLEALVKPAALHLFRARGIDVHRTFQRVESQVDGATMEIDLILENAGDVVVVEVKSALKVADVEDFLTDLDDFLRFFPRYRGMNIYGAVAGLTIDENADRYAYRRGLFVLAVSGDNVVRILNDPNFKPRDFGRQAHP